MSPNHLKLTQETYKTKTLLLRKGPLIFMIFAVNLNCGAFSHIRAFFLQCSFITELFFHSALYSELFMAELFQNRAYYPSAFIGGAFLQHDRSEFSTKISSWKVKPAPLSLIFPELLIFGSLMKVFLLSANESL